MIKLKNLEKVYTTEEVETTALNNINLEIKEGEFVAIMGPSGCGKSTLLNILGLLDNPSGGEYHFGEHEVARYSERQRAQLRKGSIGFVFQSFNLIGDLTVYENVEYPLTFRGIPVADRKARVDAALARVGLTTRANSRPGSLSGGHQQLVAVARAITGRPAVLLADEPTGNLDSKAGDALRQMFAELHTDGATVCVVTHDPRWTEQAQRHIHLFDGRIVSHS